ncbi:MAG: hypothetical protein ACI97B_003734 [Verrucomicrobiales bacterium]|jgi:hypothetical protein
MRFQLAGKLDLKILGLGLTEGLGSQYMLDLAGADAEGERSECAVRRGVGVSANNGQSGNGDAQLGADDVNDPLIGAAHTVEGDPEFFAVGFQGLDLSQGDGILDLQPVIRGGHVVIHGGKRELRMTHLATGQPQAFESLRAGDFMYEMAIDVQYGGAVLEDFDHVAIPYFVE